MEYKEEEEKSHYGLTTRRETENKEKLREENVKRKLIGLLMTVALILSIGATPVFAQTVTLELGVYDNVFNLENKDDNWAVIPDDNIGAQFGYNGSGATFDFGLIAEGLAVNTDYSLIYYADTEDRYVDWGGKVADSVGTVIKTGTSDSTGALVMSGTEELGMDLPCLPDANAYFYDYTQTPDGYNDATGAKVWLVPSSVLMDSALPVATWSPDDTWLFETQLVNYDDTDVTNPEMISITVDPASLNFGLATPGTVLSRDLTITNTGFVPVNVTAAVTGEAAWIGMRLDGDVVTTWTTDIPYTTPDSFDVVTAQITAPATPGAYDGVLTFTATEDTTP